jgi:ribosomal protein S18 acetylase RimI-like enzyme
MGNSLWAQLGQRFLTELYRGLVDSPYFLGFVYEERDENSERRVLGFIAGSTDTDRMFKHVFQKRAALLSLTAAPKLILRPGLILRLLQTPKYSKISTEGMAEIPGESLFCSFEPQLRGKRIAGHINKVLFDELLARGHAQVKISTETDNQGANRQLQSWGFEVIHQFRFYGKEMQTYALNLEESDRVEARSLHRAV